MNFKLLFFSLFSIISFSSFSQCPLDLDETTVAPTTNLLLHMPFNGDLTNLGSGNYTITNSGAQFVPTQCGQGLYFDGTNDFVNVSPSMYLANDFTVCSWISPTSQVDWMGIFSIREQCTSTYRGYSILQFNLGDYNVATLNNQVNVHQNCTGFSGGDRYTNTGILIPNNTETFVALTVQNNSSENRIVKLYVNCAEYSTSMTIDFPTAVCFSGSQNYTTTIGASSGVTNQTSTFHGVIDQLRVYDVVLNHEQILDVYQSCLPVTIDVTEYPDCNTDSAEITLFNSELDVNYQLVNATSSTPVGPVIPGNCGPITFNTGIYSSTTQFEITATNVVSGCSIVLDSIITLSPSINTATSTQNVTLCSGDSIQMNSGYITSAGTYTDTIPLSATCDSIITLNVTEVAPYNFTLGPDLQLCPSTSQTLSVPAGADTYLWQDGSTLTSYQITQGGTYWLTVTDQCGVYSDTVTFTYANDDLDLGADTSICEGTSIVLDASTANATYLWHDNSVGSTFTTAQVGTYWVEAAVSGCIFTDTITVSLQQLPTVALGNDTTICEGDLLTLTPVTQYVSNYLWSTSETSNSINASLPGTYWLQCSNQCGIDTDSLIVSVEPTPYFSLGNDTTLCVGNTLTLQPIIPYTSILWQDGSQSASYLVDQPGIYSATIWDQNCSYQDIIEIDYISAPLIDLGADTVICEGEQFFLTVQGNTGSLLWSNGSQEPTIIVTQAGTYSVSATNNCGQHFDEIDIQTTSCSCEIYVPNSFTPDGGSHNNEFGPVHDCDLLSYSFKIFNRWGEIIFESTNPLEMWDATYLNKKVQTGVYIYELLYSTEYQEETKITGHVNLLY